MSIRIHAHPAASAVTQLLCECGLPTADLTASHFQHFLACGSKASPTGVVGLELHGEAALLRSLAVARSARGLGCGRALVDAAERLAWANGVSEIYLLTDAAEGFFVRLGYERADRALVPSPIARTPEYAVLCPASSTLMVKRRER